MFSKKLINNELKFTLTFKTQLLTIEYLGGFYENHANQVLIDYSHYRVYNVGGALARDG